MNVHYRRVLWKVEMTKEGLTKCSTKSNNHINVKEKGFGLMKEKQEIKIIITRLQAFQK